MSYPAATVRGMNRTDRLYALTEELRAVAPRPRSGSWLADHLAVSVRTIERDVALLQEAGIPVHAENGRAGGYVLDPTWSRSLLRTTPEEVLAAAVAIHALSGTPLYRPARRALRRLLASLPRPELTMLRALTTRLRLLPDPGPDVDWVEPEWVESTLPGWHERGLWEPAPADPVPGVLRLEYRDEAGRLSVREVEPLGVFGGAEHWYLLAWCRLRRDIRGFRLDRVLSVEATGEPAPERTVHLSPAVVPGTDLLTLDLTDPLPLPAA